MSFKNQCVVIILCYFISLLFVRGFLYGIKRYQLNNSAYKKRKKEKPLKNGCSTADIRKKYQKCYVYSIMLY